MSTTNQILLLIMSISAMIGMGSCIMATQQKRTNPSAPVFFGVVVLYAAGFFVFVWTVLDMIFS